MKKRLLLVYFLLLIFALAGCNGTRMQESSNTGNMEAEEDTKAVYYHRENYAQGYAFSVEQRKEENI